MPGDVMRRALLHDVTPHSFPRMAHGYNEHQHLRKHSLHSRQRLKWLKCPTSYYAVSPVRASEEHHASIFGVAHIHFDPADKASAPLKHWCYLPDYTASY
jgi:hypothetical protein